MSHGFSLHCSMPPLPALLSPGVAREREWRQRGRAGLGGDFPDWADYLLPITRCKQPPLRDQSHHPHHMRQSIPGMALPPSFRSGQLRPCYRQQPLPARFPSPMRQNPTGSDWIKPKFARASGNALAPRTAFTASCPLPRASVRRLGHRQGRGRACQSTGTSLPDPASDRRHRRTGSWRRRGY
ncbi:MAG: hypothetical protein JWO89_346 [Verrucomicrobiaceae bacterium]|nr:hypothetical protein [Verrucomicrobiaceae bacterium]